MKLLTTKEAAEYLGYSEYSLRRARVKGEKLAGVQGPKFKKLGNKSIRYLQKDLDAWVQWVAQ